MWHLGWVSFFLPLIRFSFSHHGFYFYCAHRGSLYLMILLVASCPLPISRMLTSTFAVISRYVLHLQLTRPRTIHASKLCRFVSLKIQLLVILITHLICMFLQQGDSPCPVPVYVCQAWDLDYFSYNAQES